MDQDQNAWIDSVLTQSGHVPASAEGSSPAAATETSPTGQADGGTVAPTGVQPGTDSSTTAGTTTDTPSVPDPTETRIAALEAQLHITAQKAAALDQIEQAARQQVWEQQRAQQQQVWQQQIEATADLAPEYAQREQARIMAEIAAAESAQYQPQIQQAQSDIEATAAVATGFYHAIQDDPEISDAVKQRVFDNARFLANLASPEVQKQTLTRERQIAEQAVERFKASQGQAQVQEIATRAQERIEQGTDLVGTAAGSVGDGDDGSVDFLVDRAFGHRR